MRADQLLVANGPRAQPLGRATADRARRGALARRRRLGGAAQGRRGPARRAARSRSPTTPSCAGCRAAASSSTRRLARSGPGRARAASASTSARAPAASPTCCWRGARRTVVGVDVGHGQLHPRLRADARVMALEGVNARHARAPQALPQAALRPARRRPVVHLADARAAGAGAAGRAATCCCWSSRSSSCSRPTSARAASWPTPAPTRASSARLRDACAAARLDGARLLRERRSRAATATASSFSGPRRHEHRPFRSASSSFRPTRRSATTS